ncbi:MAG: segregation and condensation protein B [Alteromonas macleodii]|jgi:segregation and condensation protein B
MAKETSALDTDLEDLPPKLRWREWMGRIEAVIFVSASPVPRVVGQEGSVYL